MSYYIINDVYNCVSLTTREEIKLLKRKNNIVEGAKEYWRYVIKINLFRLL